MESSPPLSSTGGLLDVSDFTSWTVTIDTTTFRSTDPGANIIPLGVFATAKAIVIAKFGGNLSLETDHNFTFNHIDWTRVPTAPDLSLYAGHLDAGFLCDTPNPAMGGTDPWVLARSVPEPSTAALAGFGVVAFIAYDLIRKRRARKV
jgi:hypothetical protein